MVPSNTRMTVFAVPGTPGIEMAVSYRYRPGAMFAVVAEERDKAIVPEVTSIVLVNSAVVFAE